MACQILVVDDDQRTREALVEILQKAGYDVVSLTSGDGVEDLLDRYNFSRRDHRLSLTCPQWSGNCSESQEKTAKLSDYFDLFRISAPFQTVQYDSGGSIFGQTFFKNRAFESYNGIMPPWNISLLLTPWEYCLDHVSTGAGCSFYSNQDINPVP